jgi:membrane protease subunit HflC
MRVDAFAKYKIIDPLRFFQTAVNEQRFKNRLETILDSSMRQVLGSRPFAALLSEERSDLMGKIQRIVQREASGFGVDVNDVRLKRADLPDESRKAVHETDDHRPTKRSDGNPRARC